MNPTLDEISRFNGGNLDEAALDTGEPINRKFFVGETVEVTEGELVGGSGVISSVIGDTVILQFADRAGGVAGRAVEVATRSLRKSFSEGDYVKVVNGIHKGETGLVVKIDKGRSLVTLVSDLSKQEVQVFLKDIAKATDSLGDTGVSIKYDVHDMVHLEYVANTSPPSSCYTY